MEIYFDCFQIQFGCRCQVREVYWEKYPSHVFEHRETRAYRPILVQVGQTDMLNLAPHHTVNSSIKAHSLQGRTPSFQINQSELEGFPTVYSMPILNKYRHVIYRWKSLELYFLNKGTLKCFCAVRFYGEFTGYIILSRQSFI